MTRGNGRTGMEAMFDSAPRSTFLQHPLVVALAILVLSGAVSFAVAWGRGGSQAEAQAAAISETRAEVQELRRTQQAQEIDHARQATRMEALAERLAEITDRLERLAEERR